MAIIIPDKNILYIQPEYPISDACKNRMKTMVEKINHNSQITMLLQRGDYNPQIKNLLKRSIKHTKTNKSSKHHQDTLKHVKTPPIRFKRGK